jgi:hypothetical protein
MAVQIKLAEFTVPKKTQYGTIERSTGQDYVWVMNPDTKAWRHCGYLAHQTKDRPYFWFSPLCDVVPELVEQIVAECAKQKKAEVLSAGSIVVEEPEQDIGDDEDELT